MLEFSCVYCDRFYCTIFSGEGDSMVQKMSSYDESYEYVELYYGVCTMMVCSCVGCDRFVYSLFWSSLQPILNQITKQTVWHKISSYVQSYENVKVYCGNAREFL